MPRKRQRYKKLMEQLKAAGNNPGDDSRVDNFLKYITGKTKLTQDNTIPAEARQLVRVALHPFAVSANTPTADERYETSMSAYSIKGLRDRSILSFADFGIQLIVGGEQSNPLFFPALLRAKYASTTDTTARDRKSDITGDTYKYRYGRTFSFPFGRTLTNTQDAESGANETSLDGVDELDVLESLKENISVSTTANENPLSISYEPELFKISPQATPLTTANQNVGSFSVG